MAPLTAQNVMTDSVVSVSPESSLLDVLRVFVEENIHGAPVVDGEELVGVITTTDLLRAQEDEHDAGWATSDYLRGVLEFSAPGWSGEESDLQDRLGQQTAADVMTKGVLTVPRDAPVTEVARLLREHRVHRLYVTNGECLCGVVSTLDLMPVIEGSAG